MKTNLNLPQSRRFRPFRQMLARCIHIHLRSPLPKIIKNGGFEVSREFNGKNDKNKAAERSCAFALRAGITQYLAEFLLLNLV